ncbi:hypothetical protein [Knoellia subterranea]|uniref:Uncharacterized protein n=1 Tax=Knoellia subterranea KCTC 19937 TaxID=1385521 RepID=A0A0A0JJN9_9MICO|nr:hypothetical protein [Knoellia subterranea]KGN37610.1 hypothetical protein N803_14450 [Knoellia subterranea KCTC 19937]
MKRLRHSSVLALTAWTLAAGLVGCGTADLSPGASSTPAPTVPITGPDDLLVGQGMLMQKVGDGPIELCIGGVAESYPPQCGGPRIVGDVDWDTLKPERASGVTWTNAIWAVGHFDQTANTFTLDRPLSLTPTAGVTPPTPADMDFPQLCKDPYAGGRSGAGSPEQQNALTMRLESLDGYIGSWVSDGSSLFNVLVRGDAEAVFAELRTVWPGGLCVEQRDLPTQSDVRAAQDALADMAGGRLLSTGGDVTSGQLEVGVTVLDRATRDAVLEAVEPWLDASQIRFTAALQPLPQ